MVNCPQCHRQVMPRAINAAQGICGRCVQQDRDSVRGYALGFGKYRCVFCHQDSYGTHIRVVIDDQLEPADLMCVLGLGNAAAEFAAKYLSDLAAAHAEEDAMAAQNEGVTA